MAVPRAFRPDEHLLGELAGAAAERAGGLSPALLGHFLPTVAAALESGTRLRRRDLDDFADQARAAAASGVPLRALVDLYLTALGQLWRVLPDVTAAADPLTDASAARVVAAGEVLLRAAADVARVLSDGYQLARRDLLRAQTTARREFVDDLLLGGSYAAGNLVERARLLGLDLAAPHAVGVVAAERPFTDSSPVTGVVERALLGSITEADVLVATKGDRLVVVFVAPDRRAVDRVIRELTSVLPDQAVAGPVRLQRLAAVGEWRIGVGRPHRGPAGVRLSFEEATDALDLGGRLGGPGRVHDAADLLVHRVLIRDESAMRELLEAVLTPLAAARGGAEPLLSTLEAYFAAGGNASAAARAMHLSVRAFTYRLSRIAELTGHDPVDPAERYVLQTAVFGARLLDLRLE